MADLINDTHYTLVIGETVISQHASEGAALRRARREVGHPAPSLRDQIWAAVRIVAPGEQFVGHSWGDVTGVRYRHAADGESSEQWNEDVCE